MIPRQHVIKYKQKINQVKKNKVIINKNTKKVECFMNSEVRVLINKACGKLLILTTELNLSQVRYYCV